MNLSVVIPAKNEQGNVVPLLREIREALDPLGIAYEAIFVDDGSDDGTADELLAAAEGRPSGHFAGLTVLHHDRSYGQSAGILSGVKAARGTWIATLDGDGQNHPADIPALWRQMQENGPDGPVRLYAGLRQKRQDSRVKLISSRIANGVRARLLRDDTRDTGCGLKLFDRAMFLELPAFNHMHRFLPALFRRQGADIVSVPVRHRPRTRGASKYGVFNRLWVGIVDLLGVMWLQRRAAVPQVATVNAVAAEAERPPAARTGTA